jgi:glycosyltransferase involved in cell wall biosynthesis
MPSVTFVSPYGMEGEPRTTRHSESAMNWYTYEIAHALNEHGCETNVIGPKREGCQPWMNDGIRIIPSYTRGDIRAASQILFAARRVKTDIIHVEHELFAYGGIASAFMLPVAMRNFGKPVVTTIHGVIPLDRINLKFVRTNAITIPPQTVRFLWKRLICDVANSSDIIHVHEPEHEMWLRNQYGIKKRIEVIPIGTQVATHRNQHEAREALRIPQGADVLLYFGYLLERKGIVPLLQSVEVLLKDNPKLVVLIAGKTPERLNASFDVSEQIAQLAASCERFRHLGFVEDEDVSALFASADAVILPYTFSMSASGPLSLAIGAQRPVLLSNVFRNSYGNAPLLFDPNVSGISQAVRAFFGDQKEKMKAVAFVDSLRPSRTWDGMAEKMITLYRSLEGRFSLRISM